MSYITVTAFASVSMSQLLEASFKGCFPYNNKQVVRSQMGLLFGLPFIYGSYEERYIPLEPACTGNTKFSKRAPGISRICW